MSRFAWFVIGAVVGIILAVFGLRKLAHSGARGNKKSQETLCKVLFTGYKGNEEQE